MSAWQAVVEPVRSVTVAMSVKCEHCSAPIPINGPTREVHCRGCQRTTSLRRLHEELSLASEGMQRLGSPYSTRYAHEARPKCRKCEQVVPVAEWISQTGASTTLDCPGCGTGLPTYPAPAWLREQLPGILQVFGGDPEIAVAEAGVALELAEESEAKPIAMACPQCAGGLTITAADERMIECRYCSTSVFLPDELWRRLHPAKTMLAWTVTHGGEQLMTVEAIAEQQRERQRKQAELEQAEAMRELEPFESQSSFNFGWLVIPVIVLVILAVVLL